MSKGIHGDAVAEVVRFFVCTLCSVRGFPRVVVVVVLNILNEGAGSCLTNALSYLYVCVCILRTASGPSFGGGKDPGTSDTGMA